ncbi:MAG: hypothetical protein KAJ12_08020 [Bacteroidetes bacterium]|nr:hypothetical protein [Bacteroidota bacterium]
MSDHVHSSTDKAVFLAQIMSVMLIWVFVIIVTVWIINLILLSIELDDVPGATVAISIVAIPVFVTLAGVLTYVFVGLQRGKHGSSTSSKEN